MTIHAKKKYKRSWFVFFGVAIILASVGVFRLTQPNATTLLADTAPLTEEAPPVNTDSIKEKVATVYRSATCGCCGAYIAYLRDNGLTVDEKIVGNDDDDLDATKAEYAIPKNLQSCHTTRIDGYTVEGHVPIKAIEKLLTEKPSVAGIALPDMPLGSPGMPGVKRGLFDIKSFTADGSIKPFIKV